MQERRDWMRIIKYLRDDMYGFCEDETGIRIFFHIDAFTDRTAPPIVGENVEVIWDDPGAPYSRPPRATKVVRALTPTLKRGTVKSFNPDKGWGFIVDREGESHFLHRCELEQDRLPRQGQRVEFYSENTISDREPRACHVRFL